jgi:hypothetical protein
MTGSSAIHCFRFSASNWHAPQLFSGLQDHRIQVDQYRDTVDRRGDKPAGGTRSTSHPVSPRFSLSQILSGGSLLNVEHRPPILGGHSLQQVVLIGLQGVVAEAYATEDVELWWILRMKLSNSRCNRF